MKIIEFIGMPGAGKTTLCDLLEKELQKKGFRVLNMHILFQNDNLIQKLKTRYNIYSARYSPLNHRLKKLLTSRQLSDQIDVNEWIQIILMMNHGIHKETKNYDYILMDEGIIQAVTALYHRITIDENMGIRDLLDTMCKEYLAETELFELDTNLDTVCQRLRDRGREDDSFVDSDISAMKALLTQKEENIRFVAKTSRFKIHHLNGDTDSNTEITGKIVNFITNPC